MKQRGLGEGSETTRIRELEAIRGIWAVMIVVFHATRSPFFFGWSRVDLFFVLSGFLATRRRLDPVRCPPRLMTDLVRRFFRLLPAYYLLLLVVAVLDAQSAYPRQTANLLATATLTQNLPLYWRGSPWDYCPDYLAHTWALANELQFFLLFSVLCRLMGTVVLVPLALVLLINSVLLRGEGLHPWTFLGRADGFALGMLLALLYAPRSRIRGLTRVGPPLAGLIGLGYLGWFLSSDGAVIVAFDRPLGMRESLAVLAAGLFYTGLMGLVADWANQPILRFLRAGWLTRLGGMSYGIYLFSFVAIHLAWDILGGTPGLWVGWSVLLSLTLAIAAAAISQVGIERPLLNWIKRRQGTPTGLAPLTTQAIPTGTGTDGRTTT